jgi:hypothetical protein
MEWDEECQCCCHNREEEDEDEQWMRSRKPDNWQCRLQ